MAWAAPLASVVHRMGGVVLMLTILVTIYSHVLLVIMHEEYIVTNIVSIKTTPPIMCTMLASGATNIYYIFMFIIYHSSCSLTPRPAFHAHFV